MNEYYEGFIVCMYLLLALSGAILFLTGLMLAAGA